MKKTKKPPKPKPPPELPITKGPPERIGDYKVLKTLGKGAFGTVYACFDPSTGKTVAIKRVRLQGVDGDELATIQMEIQLLQSLAHKNIVQYIDTIVEPEYFNIVLEYIEAGQLSSLLHLLGSTPPESLIAFYTAQILAGLQYLHKQGVVHRDIKGANILTTKEGLVKLADFGVATKLTDSNTGVAGTPYWMAPEVISMHEETVAASDIWSLGCTVIELLTGNPPYHNLNPMSACYHIVQDPIPPLPEEMSAELESFLINCLVKDPSKRADATTLLRHPWLASSLVLLKERQLMMSPRGGAFSPRGGLGSDPPPPSVAVTSPAPPPPPAVVPVPASSVSSTAASPSFVTLAAPVASSSALSADASPRVSCSSTRLSCSSSSEDSVTPQDTNSPTTPAATPTSATAPTITITTPMPSPTTDTAATSSASDATTSSDTTTSTTTTAIGTTTVPDAATTSTTAATATASTAATSTASTPSGRVPPPPPPERIVVDTPSSSPCSSLSPSHPIRFSLDASPGPSSLSPAATSTKLKVTLPTTPIAALVVDDEQEVQDGFFTLIATLRSPRSTIESQDDANLTLSQPKMSDTASTFNRNMFVLESATDENSVVRACLRIQRGLSQIGTAESIRDLLLSQGLAVFHLLIQNSTSVVVQEALLHTLNVALNQPPVPFSNNALLSNLRRACAALGLIGQVAKTVAAPHQPLQLVSTALLRMFCWDDPNSFLSSGAVMGLQKLLVAEKDPRLQWTAVDCLARLTSEVAQVSHGVSARDVCLKLAGTYDIVRLLTANFNQRANDFSAMRGRKPNKTHVEKKRPSMVTEVISPVIISRRTLEKAHFEAICRLCISPLEDVDLLDVAFLSFGAVHLRRQSSGLSSPSQQGDGMLLSATSIDVPTRRSSNATPSSAESRREGRGRHSGALDLPLKADFALSVDCQKKIALILNTIAKSHDLARQKFTAHEITSLVVASVASHEPSIAALMMNTLAILCSTPVLGKLHTGLEMDHHYPQFVSELVYLLKNFLALGEEQVWQWAAADTLHCLHRLSQEVEKESGASPNESRESFRESQSTDETGTLVLALKHNALMPQLHYMLISWANQESEAKREAKEGKEAKEAKEASPNVNPDEIILKREGPVRMIQFLFPLLYRIATSFSATVRSFVHAYKPEIFLPLLVHPDYRASTLDLLYVWLQDDQIKLEAFLGSAETIQVVVSLLSSANSNEYTKLLTTLIKMLSHGKVLNPIYATFPAFCAELKEALCVRYRDDNAVRLLILRLVYIFISRATQAQLKHITVSLDLIELLTPLTQDPLSPLVATLADSLLESAKAPTKTVNSSSKGRKYKKAAIKRCMLCDRVFSLFVRKHYCKQCQLVVCGNCSPDRVLVAHVNKDKTKRVCATCFDFLKSRE